MLPGQRGAMLGGGSSSAPTATVEAANVSRH